MSDLIERAKTVGLNSIQTWLPDGFLRGNEWVSRNPTRPDDEPGSFSVNVKTGKWADFAETDAKGNDCISLYAYLFADTLEGAAKKHKTLKCGLQIEAAREILKNHDASYFPSDQDNFDPISPSTHDTWLGWEQVEEGIEKPPGIQVNWFAKKWGKCVDKWEFKKDKKTLMIVCRFVLDGKKSDRPFTLWKNGGDYKWRAKALKGKYPLWNLDKLVKEKNLPVLLCEGQKVPSVLDPIMSEFVCVGWYGGAMAIQKTDWEPLAGREVFFSPDADEAGRSTIDKIKKILNSINAPLTIVYPPKDAPKGWDLADTIPDGWTEEELMAFIRSEERTPTIEDERAFDFRVLGYCGDHVAFYPFRAGRVYRHKASSLTKGVLMTLMDRKKWGALYMKDDGGIAWDSAINDMLRKAEEERAFDPTDIRGPGAWIDDGKVIINSGEKLIIDNREVALFDAPGRFVYEKGRVVPYKICNAMTSENSKKLAEVCNLVPWKNRGQGDLLVGWMLLAPFGGALRWRSHVWLTGKKGSGKSWVLENIVYPTVGLEFGIRGLGTSTPAGIRSALGNSSLATIMDEMESDNVKYSDYIEQNLKAFREGSSGSGKGAATLHGSQDGEGRQWLLISMALFASISASIKHAADRDRFTVLTILNNFANIEESESKFAELKTQIKILTPDWVRAFHGRTLRIFSEVQKAIQIVTDQAVIITGERRAGDQLGTLAAGAWMSYHETAPSAYEAVEYLRSLNIEMYVKETENKSDEDLCFDEIMSARIEVDSGRTTVGAVISSWLEFEEENPKNKKTLEQYGLKLIDADGVKLLYVAIAHPRLKQLMKDTAWRETYDIMLARMPACNSAIKGPTRFAGVCKRYREINLTEVFYGDNIPF